jgi:inorganic triphosphatase YgiF
MGVEREYKFDVDPDWPAPDLAGPAGGGRSLADENLVSIYFDTADHRLWSAGMTLRHRAKGDGPGKWTLKRPEPEGPGGADMSVRTELDWDGPTDDPPTGLMTTVDPVTGGEALVELARLSSVRRRLLLGGTTEWAELDDDSVTVTSGPRAGLRFRQVELELLDEPPAGCLDAVLAVIDRAGAVPGGASKIGLAAGLEPPG